MVIRFFQPKFQFELFFPYPDVIDGTPKSGQNKNKKGNKY